MYQLTVKGNNLEELRVNLINLNSELNPCTKDVNPNELRVAHEPVEYPEQESASTEISEDTVEAITEAEKFAKLPVNIQPGLEVAPEDNSELDSEGIPWDKRIHSASRGKVKDGTYRQKRNLEAEFVETIKAELKRKIERAKNPIAIPSAPIEETTPIVETVTPAIVETVTPAIVETPAMNADVAPPVIEVAAPPVSMPNMSSGHTLETFTNNFAMIVGTLITDGKIDQAYLNSLKDYFKVEQIWDVTPEQKAEMFNSFAEFGFIQKVG